MSGRPMSWEQYWELPDELRAEYVDGLVYVNPPATFRHQELCQRLRDVATAAFGDRCLVAVAVGWRLPTQRRILRIPDLMLLTAKPEGDVVTGPVPVAVEVLSTKRAYDLVLKAGEYLEAGAGQYWVADPADRSFAAFGRDGAEWAKIAELDDETPSASFGVPPFGEISISSSELFS